jgi:hypothetical protein
LSAGHDVQHPGAGTSAQHPGAGPSAHHPVAGDGALRPSAGDGALRSSAGDGGQTHPVAELRVTGHLMTLEPGMFCIIHNSARVANGATGLPGVRVSLPPGPIGQPDAVRISSFRDDGWLDGHGDAALVRITGAAAQILVTIYQMPGLQDAAPNLQVLRLAEAAAPTPARATARLAAEPANSPAKTPAKTMDMVAHIQGRGDVGAMLGEWLGEPGRQQWIEGFAIAPTETVPADAIEYQAVLGRGWLSPWVEAGQFCGSRGMALPVLGLKLRLRGEAAERFDCHYSASFIDGTRLGPLRAGESCEAASLSPLEAFQVVLRPRGAPAPAKPATAKTKSPRAKR